jgi:hypothetical protein
LTRSKQHRAEIGISSARHRLGILHWHDPGADEAPQICALTLATRHATCFLNSLSSTRCRDRECSGRSFSSLLEATCPHVWSQAQLDARRRHQSEKVSERRYITYIDRKCITDDDRSVEEPGLSHGFYLWRSFSSLHLKSRQRRYGTSVIPG